MNRMHLWPQTTLHHTAPCDHPVDHCHRSIGIQHSNRSPPHPLSILGPPTHSSSSSALYKAPYDDYNDGIAAVITAAAGRHTGKHNTYGVMTAELCPALRWRCNEPFHLYVMRLTLAASVCISMSALLLLFGGGCLGGHSTITVPSTCSCSWVWVHWMVSHLLCCGSRFKGGPATRVVKNTSGIPATSSSSKVCPRLFAEYSLVGSWDGDIQCWWIDDLMMEQEIEKRDYEL